MQNKNVLYATAIKRVLEKDTLNETLPEGDLGNDPTTGKAWAPGRAKRELRKYIYDLTHQNPELTDLKLKDMLEAAQQELVPA